MKGLLFLIFMLCTMTLSGQKVLMDESRALVVDPAKAKYTVVTDYEKNPLSFKETVFYITGEMKSENYYVASNDKNGISVAWYLDMNAGKFVKNGKSIQWYKNGQKESEDNYINGKLKGKSLEWYENGQLKSEKNYLNDKIDGKSIEWYQNGRLIEEIDCSNGEANRTITTYWKNGNVKRKDIYKDDKLGNGSCYDTLGNVIKHFDLEKMPEYSGGDRQLMTDINYSINYPTRSRDAGIQGRVVIRFAVNELGKICEAVILEGVNNELNREALRVISKLRKFKPGYSDGEPAKVYFMVPITFSLR